jgi:hypothetical protein
MEFQIEIYFSVFHPTVCERVIFNISHILKNLLNFLLKNVFSITWPAKMRTCELKLFSTLLGLGKLGRFSLVIFLLYYRLYE